MSGQLAALVATHLSDRRRSLLAWGIPLGLWSAFIVIIFPSVEEALSKAVQNYPDALKEAFGIGQLTSVEQYLQAEMLSLIVPLALGYLAVRAISSGLAGAAESGRLEVLLSAPVSRTRLVAAGWSAPISPSGRRSPGMPTSGRRRCSLPASAPLLPASRCAPASSPAPSPGCWSRCT